MQFAVPTRNHRSSPFLFSSVSRQFIRRRRPLYLVVLVTVLDRKKYSAEYLEKVIENRKEYAEAHGYGLFIRDLTDYDMGTAPAGWARIPATRHAMSLFDESEWFWYLDQNSIIMNPSLGIQSHVTAQRRLGSLMLRNVPIVPPDSVIRTYRHTPPERIHFILTQDHDGLNPGSFLIKQGSWARYFLDVWMDPLFINYNFRRAEQMALEHIVQWHPTILVKLALIPQKVINSYPTLPGQEGSYEEGDFVVHFQGCEASGRNCEKEFERFWEKRGRSMKR
ncbi:galactosyl transferase [Kalaharituber pfeilii]|nr:galactosyl transferase [Kalaharituber pfeilii]